MLLVFGYEAKDFGVKNQSLVTNDHTKYFVLYVRGRCSLKAINIEQQEF